MRTDSAPGRAAPFSYPSGHVRDQIERAFLVLAYAVSLLWQLAPSTARRFSLFGLHAARPLAAVHRRCDRPDVDREGLLGPVHRARRGVHRTRSAAVAAGFRRARRGRCCRWWRPRASPGAQFIALRAATLTDWNQAFGTLDWLDNLNTLVVPAAIFVGIATIRRNRGAGANSPHRPHRPAQRQPRRPARPRGDFLLDLARQKIGPLWPMRHAPGSARLAAMKLAIQKPRVVSVTSVWLRSRRLRAWACRV